MRPSGKYLMEDLFYAGGIPAVMKEIESLLHRDAVTANGRTVGENIAGAQCHNRDVIRALDNPLQPEGGTVILYGSLAPNGAVIKQSAAEPHLLKHTGRAVVFEDHDDLMARVDDPDLDIDESCVMVLRHGGPIGAPGMPEYGNLPIPAKLLKKGVSDMVRISDAVGCPNALWLLGSYRVEARYHTVLVRVPHAQGELAREGLAFALDNPPYEGEELTPNLEAMLSVEDCRALLLANDDSSGNDVEYAATVLLRVELPSP